MRRRFIIYYGNSFIISSCRFYYFFYTRYCYYCMYTKTHFHNNVRIFTHVHRSLGHQTCQEHVLLSSACAILRLFLIILDHRLLHGWPQGIFISLLYYYYYYFPFRITVLHQVIFVLRPRSREWCQPTLTLLCSHLRSRPRTPFIFFSSISICGL